MRDFILRELDRVGLGDRNTFTVPAVDLVVRCADGVVRQGPQPLCQLPDRGFVRSATKKRDIDIDNVNRVLMQPHWQKGDRLGRLLTATVFQTNVHLLENHMITAELSCVGCAMTCRCP